ncbi:AraC family ligand binding domain-containing protein [Pedobacter sp. NJ-S-72]
MINSTAITIDIDTSLSDSFSIGYLSTASFELNQSYRISFNQLLFFKKGKGKILVDGRIYVVSPGTLILLAKNQVYSFKKSQGLEAYSLCFGDCFWEKTPASANNCKATLFNDAAAHQYLKLQKDDVLEMNRLFQEILKEFETADYSNKKEMYLLPFLKF